MIRSTITFLEMVTVFRKKEQRYPKKRPSRVHARSRVGMKEKSPRSNRTTLEIVREGEERREGGREGREEWKWKQEVGRSKRVMEEAT